MVMFRGSSLRRKSPIRNSASSPSLPSLECEVTPVKKRLSLLSNSNYYSSSPIYSKPTTLLLLVFCLYLLYHPYSYNYIESPSKTWTPKSTWDRPPLNFYNESDTGSLQNCKPGPKSNYKIVKNQNSGELYISCQKIKFKASYQKIANAKGIIVGVLSAASGSGPKRRNYIRSTWASNEISNSVFFLVAGPWKDIKDEFKFYNDLIWIDQKEVYQGEKSVLTHKTMSFFAIIHLFGNQWKHAIKTDDDSYVNIGKIEHEFLNGGQHANLHYYGQCPQFQVKPSRDVENKWPVTYLMYPEPSFPLYCQGAGFGVSREFISRAVEGGHIANFRYMPFEDVSIGILAERCGKDIHATMIPGIKVFRADTPKERDCVNLNIKMSECYKGDDSWPPDAHMKNKLIQHRVADKEEMVNIHKSLGLKVNWVETLNDAKKKKKLFNSKS